MKISQLVIAVRDLVRLLGLSDRLEVVASWSAANPKGGWSVQIRPRRRA